ncbi:hypothetical protein SELMODRAFT_422742 [Selaginella moellendorffii]|uniref:Uncharacterized protein n=1 Tax=Selaginella moellendorffii TaxID=88036 RepID=D8SJE5_SELML|nr:hypothetical protein SELMODRAFT_422742 [Selaginella moellendorffii]
MLLVSWERKMETQRADLVFLHQRKRNQDWARRAWHIENQGLLFTYHRFQETNARQVQKEKEMINKEEKCKLQRVSISKNSISRFRGAFNVRKVPSLPLQNPADELKARSIMLSIAVKQLTLRTRDGVSQKAMASKDSEQVNLADAQKLWNALQGGRPNPVSIKDVEKRLGVQVSAFDDDTHSRLHLALLDEDKEAKPSKGRDFENCAEHVVFEKLARLNESADTTYAVQKHQKKKGESNVVCVKRCVNCLKAGGASSSSGGPFGQTPRLGAIVTDHDSIAGLSVPINTMPVMVFIRSVFRALRESERARVLGLFPYLQVWHDLSMSQATPYKNNGNSVCESLWRIRQCSMSGGYAQSKQVTENCIYNMRNRCRTRLHPCSFLTVPFEAETPSFPTGLSNPAVLSAKILDAPFLCSALAVTALWIRLARERLSWPLPHEPVRNCCEHRDAKRLSGVLILEKIESQVAAFGFVLLEAAVLCPMLGAFVSCPKGHRFKICASCGQQNKAGLVSHELTLLDSSDCRIFAAHGACCAGATMGDHQARKETALFSEAGIDAAILVNASSLLPLFFLKERPGCMDAEGPDPAISQLTSLKDILIQQTYGPIALNSRETWMLVQKKKRNSSTYVGTQAFSYRVCQDCFAYLLFSACFLNHESA